MTARPDRSQAMTDHLKPQSPELVAALQKHGLQSDTPSQLSDAFRLGWTAALSTPATEPQPAADTRVVTLDQLQEWRTIIRAEGYDETSEAMWQIICTDITAPSDKIAEAARVRPEAIEALAAYRQADMDGIMVLVSRQAIEECLPALRALAGKGE